jgi:hypothetical protein
MLREILMASAFEALLSFRVPSPSTDLAADVVVESFELWGLPASSTLPPEAALALRVLLLSTKAGAEDVDAGPEVCGCATPSAFHLEALL